MKFAPLFIFLTTFPVLAAEEEVMNSDDLVILSASSEKSLGIKIEASLETDFETTLFSIGRIQEVPSNHRVVSSRIAGRVTQLHAIAGDHVNKGDLLVQVESRQAGNPPPTIPLHAPSSGIIAESHIRLGEPVDPGKELLDILDLTQVWAVARVPEQEAGNLAIGAKARIRVSALGKQTLEGKLIRFGTTADPSSGTIDAIFLLENPDNRLRPGMRSEFSIVTAYREDVTVVPREAVQGDPTNQVVYIKDFNLPHTYIKSPVVTGEENDQYIEIKEGIFPDDEVVTNGAYLLGFAGAGNVSLKDALDAAHGHEHNVDGSEVAADQKASKSGDLSGAQADHRDSGPMTVFLGVLCLILFFLLVISSMKNARDRRHFTQPEA